jgi:two-component system sensor histidine kinase DegS
MLFRLVQEALLNARKHAHARLLSVSLDRRASEVVLNIEDDGCGFATASIPAGHYGLLTMRERAEVSGGVLEITSQLGRGTLISVRFPLETSS